MIITKKKYKLLTILMILVFTLSLMAGTASAKEENEQVQRLHMFQSHTYPTR